MDTYLHIERGGHMAENSCPYHTDHDNRLKKLEQGYEELDDRVTVLDKEHAVNRVEITSTLKNFENLPETMLQMSNTMIAIQGEIKAFNASIDGRIQGVEAKTDSKFTGVDEKIKDINGKMSVLDNRVLQINELDTINFRQAFKNWFLKNWQYIGIGLAITAIYVANALKGLVS